MRGSLPKVLLALLLELPAAAQDDRPPPSVLFLMPDQMRGMDMGCMGNGEVQTPNLDRLAAEGILFRNTIANSPVCCPARAVILTGQYAHTNGVVCNDLRLRESATTLAEFFAAAGYRTGFIGKWHLDGGKRDPGFVPPGERRQGFEFWAALQCAHDHFGATYFRDDEEPIVSRRYETLEWADVADEFLASEDERPFFLMLCPGPPHNPYEAPREYSQLYDRKPLTMRRNWKRSSGSTRRHLAGYYAQITAVDDMVGRVLEALERSGRARDTIVLFTSDHGDQLGSQGETRKRKPWEESILVPGILRYPAAVGSGVVIEDVWSHVDFAPTLLGLAGLEAPASMQGRDVSRRILGEDVAGPGVAYLQIFVPYLGDGLQHPWRGVRTRRHLYARTAEGPWLLYDLESDPYQMRNLAQAEEAAAVRSDLERLLAERMQATGDDWSHDTMEPVEDDDRLCRGPAFYTLDEYRVWARSNPAQTVR